MISCKLHKTGAKLKAIKHFKRLLKMALSQRTLQLQYHNDKNPR